MVSTDADEMQYKADRERMRPLLKLLKRDEVILEVYMPEIFSWREYIQSRDQFLISLLVGPLIFGIFFLMGIPAQLFPYVLASMAVIALLKMCVDFVYFQEIKSHVYIVTSDRLLMREDNMIFSLPLEHLSGVEVAFRYNTKNPIELDHAELPLWSELANPYWVVGVIEDARDRRLAVLRAQEGHTEEQEQAWQDSPRPDIIYLD